jgi:rRNA small subunit pseudouridine methyltransferase Nep1
MNDAAESEPDSRMPRVYVVLERASLEVHESKGKATLLNSEEHQGYLRKLGRDIGGARPDIVHQVQNTFSSNTHLMF